MTEPTKKPAKPKRGRPITRKMPERIDASPDRIAEVILRATPPKKWRYLESNPNHNPRLTLAQDCI